MTIVAVVYRPVRPFTRILANGVTCEIFRAAGDARRMPEMLQARNATKQ
jgi:hypothetical protein